MKLKAFNTAKPEERIRLLLNCCQSRNWAGLLSGAAPFDSSGSLLIAAADIWNSMGEEDFLEASRGHPRIGDLGALQNKYGASPAEEQSGVRGADVRVLDLLKVQNERYLEKFGFIFIVYAPGKSAEDMLDLLEERLKNSREAELANGAGQQLLIMEARLRKLLESS